MNDTKRSVLPGIILIIIGVLILVHKLDIYHFYWDDVYPIVFILLRLWCFAGVFARKKKGLAFPGTFFLLLGLTFVLRNNFYSFYWDWDAFWPVYLIIFGLAFIVQFMFNHEDWGLLIPGSIFILIGFTFLARTMNWYLPFRVEYLLSRYWPVILIIIGIAIILSSLSKRGKPSGT